MLLALFKYFLINTIAVAEGFCLALLLREQYRLRTQAVPEEFVPLPLEPLLPPPIAESEEPSVLSSMEQPPTQPEEPSVSESLSGSQYRRIDDLDDSLLPKGFKVESVLENLQVSPNPTTENAPDFSVVVHQPDPYSVADTAFEDDDDAVPPPTTSGPRPPLDIDAEPTGTATRDSEGISSLAVELLGKDFDFRSLVKQQSEADVPSVVEITDLDNDTYRTESGFLTDAAAVRESLSEQWVGSTFLHTMVDSLFVEPDRSQVFTEDSPPMLDRRRKSKRSA